MDDQEIGKLLIVTQTSRLLIKHPGGDRTGNFITRTKMDTEIAQAIDDGLYYYEQVRGGGGAWEGATGAGLEGSNDCAAMHMAGVGGVAGVGAWQE